MMPMNNPRCGCGMNSSAPDLPATPILPASQDGQDPGEVNVIFRGLYLFAERKESIDVLIPNMGGEHMYRAGTFLAEMTMAPRPMSEPYILGGVVSGNARFDDNNANIYRGHAFAPNLNPCDVYARILLPTPKEIICLRKTRSALQAQVDPLGLINGKKMPCVHIFRYDATDMTQVWFYPQEPAPGLGIHHMDGVVDGNGQQKNFKNVHILCEPEYFTARNPAHTLMGMERSTALIEDLQGSLRLKPNSSTVAEKVTGDYSQKGFAPIETLTLAEVQLVLAQAGQSWRNGHPFMPTRSGFVDDPPYSCIPQIVSTI